MEGFTGSNVMTLRRCSFLTPAAPASSSSSSMQSGDFSFSFSFSFDAPRPGRVILNELSGVAEGVEAEVDCVDCCWSW